MRCKTLLEFSPVVGETLLLKQKPTNCMDLSAVATTCKENLIAQFLQRDCNKGFAEVTGPRVNRGAGYGLEIPCVYKLYGPKPYTASFPGFARPRSLITHDRDRLLISHINLF